MDGTTLATAQHDGTPPAEPEPEPTPEPAPEPEANVQPVPAIEPPTAASELEAPIRDNAEPNAADVSGDPS